MDGAVLLWHAAAAAPGKEREQYARKGTRMMITAHPDGRAAVRIRGVTNGRVGEALVHADTEMLGSQSRGQAGSTTIVRARSLLPFAECGATENRSDLPDKEERRQRKTEESRAKVGTMGDSMATQGERYTSRPWWRRQALAGQAADLLRGLECAYDVAARQQLPHEDDRLTQPVQCRRDEGTEGDAAREFCAKLGKGHSTRCQHAAVLLHGGGVGETSSSES